MALRSSTVQVPIRGLTTQANAKAAFPGDADLIENMYAKLFGSNSGELRKRSGGVSLTKNIFTGGSVSVGRKLATFNDEKLLVSDTALYSYSPQTIKWHNKGTLTPAKVTAEFVADSVHSRRTADVAISGNLACFVDIDDQPSAFITIIDLSTGTKLLKDTWTGTNANDGVRVVALSSAFLIVTSIGGTFQAMSISYATPTTLSGVTTIATNGSAATPRWDVTRNGTADQMLLAYNGDAANRLRAVLWNSGMTSAGSFLSGEQPDGAITWLDHDYLNGSAYIGYVDSTRGLKVMTVTIAGFSVASSAVLDVARTTGRNVTGYHSGGANVVFVEVAGAATYLNKIVVSTGAACADWQLGAGLTTKVFKVASTYYLTAAFADGFQDKYFILNATNTAAPAIVVGQALDGLGGGLSYLVSGIGAAAAISSTVVAVPVNRYETTVLTGARVYSVVYLRVDFSPTLSSPKRVGENLHFPGGAVRLYDGVSVTEAGFSVCPTIYSVTQGGGGALTATGTYSIVAVYLWLDSRGQLHRSLASPATTVTLTGANNAISTKVTSLRLGDKPRIGNGVNNAFIEFYATTNGGSTYFKQSGNFNDPTTDFAAINLTAVDTTGLVLYTDGGPFPHSSFPPAAYMETWRDRLFLAGTENPNDLWVSNSFRAGQGVSFSDQLVIRLQADGGPITAIAEMEDRLVIFKRDAIYVMAGIGPSLNGDAQYDQPTRIEADLGSADPQGVTKTRDGLLFKSQKGIYLLTRSLECVPIGQDVVFYDNLTVTSGALAENAAQVRFTTSAGRTLVYHTNWKDEDGVGYWSTFTGQAAVDSIVWGGKWAYLSSAGLVTEETAGVWQDDGVNYTTTLSIGWLNLAGLFGEFAVWEIQLLVDPQGSFTLGAALSVDDNPAVVQSPTIAVTAGTIPPIPIKPLRQNVRTLYVSLTETSATEGYRISGLALDLGVEGRIKSTAPTARMT